MVPPRISLGFEGIWEVGAGDSEERALFLEPEESHGCARPGLSAKDSRAQASAATWIAHDFPSSASSAIRLIRIFLFVSLGPLGFHDSTGPSRNLWARARSWAESLCGKFVHRLVCLAHLGPVCFNFCPGFVRVTRRRAMHHPYYKSPIHRLKKPTMQAQ